MKIPLLSVSLLKPDPVRLASAASVGVAIILLLLKLVAFNETDSSALLASLADSGLDLVASIITFFTVRFAAKPPDTEHPFGHGKAEAFSALFQAGLVFASSALVLQDSISALMSTQAAPPKGPAGFGIFVMIFSLVLTFLLLALQSWAIKKSGSIAIKADKMHYLTDILSQFVALLGLIAYGFGIYSLDGAAGIIIGIILFLGAIKVLREASDHLMDHALDKEDLDKIIALILEDGRLKGVHQLRTRISGPHILVQLHVEMSADLSLIEAHKIMLEAENRVLTHYPNADILIHPDPIGYAEAHGGIFSRLSDIPTKPEALTRG